MTPPTKTLQEALDEHQQKCIDAYEYGTTPSRMLLEESLIERDAIHAQHTTDLMATIARFERENGELVKMLSITIDKFEQAQEQFYLISQGEEKLNVLSVYTFFKDYKELLQLLLVKYQNKTGA